VGKRVRTDAPPKYGSWGGGAPSQNLIPTCHTYAEYCRLIRQQMATLDYRGPVQTPIDPDDIPSCSRYAPSIRETAPGPDDIPPALTYDVAIGMTPQNVFDPDDILSCSGLSLRSRSDMPYPHFIDVSSDEETAPTQPPTSETDQDTALRSPTKAHHQPARRPKKPHRHSQPTRPHRPTLRWWHHRNGGYTHRSVGYPGRCATTYRGG